MSNRRRQRGVTLIEVLIAIVIMAIGLIGIAAMQAAALGNNQLSFEYTQVVTAGQNLAERMRANRDGVSNNFYLFAAGTPGNPGVNCATASCTSQQQANWDLAAWYASLAPSVSFANVPATASANLPGVQVAVACETVTCVPDDVRTITIFWDSRRNGATGIACDPDDNADLACVRLPFTP